MKVYWELAQELRRRRLELDDGRSGDVEGIQHAHTESSADAELPQLDLPECCIRVLSEPLLDLEQSRLQFLSNLRHDAHRSEEFFFLVNAADQCLRTVIGHDVLHPETWIKDEPIKKDIIIYSNVLPKVPFWSKPSATKKGANGKVHCSSRMLEEACKKEKTLRSTLQEWGNNGEELCNCDNAESGQSSNGDHEPADLFSEIQGGVQFVKELYRHGSALIWVITWEGSRFIQKKFMNPQSCDTELEIVKSFSHPHLIFSFGKLVDKEGMRSYFMEYMSTDLYKLIEELIRVHDDDEQPPFGADAAVDILLQVAKAMRYMHQQHVVHCDLKSGNILISEIAENRYLVKVADFGSARLWTAGNFCAGPGTCLYLAPEHIQQLHIEDPHKLHIEDPHKIDVYSFGIVASEVLTGTYRRTYKESMSKFKDGVIKGTRRPPLRAECKKHKRFIQDEGLLSLIEKCWHGDPSERPSFDEICKELEDVRIPLSQGNPQTGPRIPYMATFLQGFPSDDIHPERRGRIKQKMVKVARTLFGFPRVSAFLRRLF